MEWIGTHYLVETVLAYGIAITIRYFVSRMFAIKESERPAHLVCPLFVLVSLCGLAFVTFLMLFMVD